MPLQPKRHMKTEKTVGQIVATYCNMVYNKWHHKKCTKVSHQIILRQTQHRLEAKKFAKSVPSQVPKMIISTMVSTWNDRRTGMLFKHQWFVALLDAFCVHYHWISWDDFRRCTRRKSLTVQNSCVRMPTSAACRLPRVRRRPCVFKNCQAESPKKIQTHKSWVQKFHPFKQTPVIFRNLIFQAPVFFKRSNPRWTKFSCSEAQKPTAGRHWPTATSCQVQRLTFAMQFWAQLLSLNFLFKFYQCKVIAPDRIPGKTHVKILGLWCIEFEYVWIFSLWFTPFNGFNICLFAHAMTLPWETSAAQSVAYGRLRPKTRTQQKISAKSVIFREGLQCPQCSAFFIR